VWSRLAQALNRAATRQQIRNAGKVASGAIDSATIRPKGLERLPINYTQEVHNSLLSKRSGDVLGQKYIQDLEHIRTLREPDYFREITPRDTHYVYDDVFGKGILGRVSVKPKPEIGQSFINSAQIMTRPREIEKELGRVLGVPTPGISAPTTNFAGSGYNGVAANIKSIANPMPNVKSSEGLRFAEMNPQIRNAAEEVEYQQLMNYLRGR
jgi:hypothetical protein